MGVHTAPHRIVRRAESGARSYSYLVMGEERAPAAASIANIQQPAAVVHPVPMIIKGAASSQGAFHVDMVAAAEAGQ
jgi:hypothetical protein